MAKEIVQLKAENRALRDQMFRYREFLAALLELDQDASRVRNGGELLRLLNRILIDAITIVEARDGTLALLDDETAELKFVLVVGEAAPALEGFRMPSNKGIMGWVVMNQRAVRIENAHRDARFFAEVDQTTGFVTRSLLAAPLLGDNRVYGVVEIINKQGDEPFSATDETLITLFCRFAGEALSRLDRELPLAG
jgi:GAF domain-containing protein